MAFVSCLGTAGCCWAFAALGAVEGYTKITTGNLINLSEQELVDCATHNYGCGGGWLTDAFHYVISRGITSEKNYPYEGKDGNACAVNSPNARAYSSVRIGNFETVPSNNEGALLKAVSRQPVAASIDGSGRNFHMYRSGVFSGGCSTSLTHAVVIVGYGTTEDGINYWLIKNSWGTSWGENGYMRLKRDVENPQGLCGIAIHAYYTVSS